MPTRQGVHADGGAPTLAHGREFDLVTVAPALARRLAGLDERLCPARVHVADAHEGVPHLIALGCELRLAGEAAPGAAPTDAHVGTGGLHTLGRGLDDAGGARTAEALAVAHDLGLHDVACHGARDEDALAVEVRYRVGSCPHALDRERDGR